MIALKKILITGSFVIFFVSLFIFWVIDPFKWSASSDEELIVFFKNHNNELTKLSQMVIDDRKILSYYTKSSISGSFSDLRAKEYRDLISTLPNNIIITVDHNQIVRFIFSGGGLLAIGGGWIKGIEYMPDVFEKSSNILQNLNDVSALRPNVYLRKIEASWYIIYQYSD